ncbi:MAG: hypothetical protein K2X49_01645 [Acetobacteraceae bacterium]|nr:hypothetical protein [Acetobacteraceae bacterium]
MGHFWKFLCASSQAQNPSDKPTAKEIADKLGAGNYGNPDSLARVPIDASDLTLFANWLSRKSFQSTEKDTASAVCAFVENRIGDIIPIAQVLPVGKNAVGTFLAEALRYYNFAHHSKPHCEQFIKWISQCGILISGNPDVCAANATFDTLGYDILTSQVTMQV